MCHIQLMVYYFLIISLGELVNVVYSPTLSSFEINIEEEQTCYLIEEELKKLIKLPSEASNFTILDEQHYLINELKLKENLSNTNDNNLRIEYRICENFVLTCYDSKISLKFNENKPAHSRSLLYEQIEDCFKKCPILNTIKITDISNSAWWSILWSPFKTFKSIKTIFNLLI